MDGKDNKRNDGEELQEAFELTPSEKKALEMLPRDRIPDIALEDRVVGALRSRGHISSTNRRVIELSARRIAAVVAACLVLLVVGFALGRWVGSRQAPGSDIITPEPSALSLAARLQQAGSAYVMALQHFAELPDSVDDEQAVDGREIALTTLYTAADQVTRLVPKNEMARQLLLAIDADPCPWTAGMRQDASSAGSRFVEF